MPGGVETFTIDEAKESTATSKDLIEAEIQKSKHELDDLKKSVIPDFVNESKNADQGHLGEARKYLEHVEDRSRNQLRNDYATMQAVQLALTKLGYDVGRIDGIL